jgi:hypothetical protein
VLSLLLGSDIGGRLVRRIQPLLVPRAPALDSYGRADVVPREHLTRHSCGLISRSGAGGVQEDAGTARADCYLIAEAAAQFRDKRLPVGLHLGVDSGDSGDLLRTGRVPPGVHLVVGQLARQVNERNADAPVVAHRRTIATLRTRTRAITAADPLPGHLPEALDRIHRHSGTH